MKEKRDKEVKLRLTATEKENLEDYACAEGESLTGVLREYCKYILKGDWREND